MPMLSLLIALTPQTPADQLIERFAAATRAAQSLSVDLTVDLNTIPLGSGSVHIDRPHKAAFVFKGPSIDYRFAFNEQAGLEVDHINKTFEELRPLLDPNRRGSRMSAISARLFPDYIITGNLRGLLPQGASFQKREPQDLDGIRAEVLQADYSSPMGSGTIRVFFNPEHRVVKLEKSETAGGPTISERFLFSNYRIGEAYGDGIFDTTLPPGYMPFALPNVDTPLEVGLPVPQGSWLSAKDGTSVQLATELKGGGLLFLVTPDCDQCSAARTLVRSLQKHKIKTVEASWSVTREGAGEALYDPEGKERDQLNPPAFPAFYLFGKDGKLIRFWYGYDPQQAKAFEADVLDAWKNPEGS